MVEDLQGVLLEDGGGVDGALHHGDRLGEDPVHKEDTLLRCGA